MSHWIKTDAWKGERQHYPFLLNLDRVKKLTLEGEGGSYYLSADGETIAVGTEKQMYDRFNDLVDRLVHLEDLPVR